MRSRLDVDSVGSKQRKPPLKHIKTAKTPEFGTTGKMKSKKQWSLLGFVYLMPPIFIWRFLGRFDWKCHVGVDSYALTVFSFGSKRCHP